ncbi:hypothetical protein PMAYCL1PPCAC_03777, partial [Pristionchus mayeri]
QLQWILSPPLFGMAPEVRILRISHFSSLLCPTTLLQRNLIDHHPTTMYTLLLPYLVLTLLAPLPFLIMAAVGIQNKKTLMEISSMVWMYLLYKDVILFQISINGSAEIIVKLVYFTYLAQGIRVILRVVHDMKK